MVKIKVGGNTSIIHSSCKVKTTQMSIHGQTKCGPSAAEYYLAIKRSDVFLGTTTHTLQL